MALTAERERDSLKDAYGDKVMESSIEPIEVLRRQMVQDVAQSLWNVYHRDAGAPFLLWPAKRDTSTRVSEQESKILITQWLQSNHHFYSVETPTSERYRQSGASELSARIDVTVYSERNTSARMLNIELKAGTPTDESFRKDFEKLLRERVRGLWFHTLTKARHGTWLSLEDRICRSLDAVIDHAEKATHVIDFAFCVLESRTLIEFSIDFQSDWKTGLHASIRRATGLTNPGDTKRSSSGSTLRPSTHPARPSVSSPNDSSLLADDARSGTLKQLVLIPSLEPKSFLHLSTRGESYKLRHFDGIHLPNPWKAASCGTLTELRAAHSATVVVDVSRDGRDLSQHEYWKERVRDLNERNQLKGYD